MKVKRAAAIVAPVVATTAILSGGVGSAGADEVVHSSVRHDEFTFNTGLDGGGEDFTCGFESKHNLWESGFATAWTYSLEGYDERCDDTVNHVFVSYTNTRGDHVEFSLSGERNANVHFNDVASDLETRHRAYYSGCGCYSPEWRLPK